MPARATIAERLEHIRQLRDRGVEVRGALLHELAARFGVSASQVRQAALRVQIEREHRAVASKPLLWGSARAQARRETVLRHVGAGSMSDEQARRLARSYGVRVATIMRDAEALRSDGARAQAIAESIAARRGRARRHALGAAAVARVFGDLELG